MTSITYKLGSHIIHSSDSVNDFCITIHSSLKPSAHCINIANKANGRSKLILKCFHSRCSSNLIRAFKTYVRPILEYASPVWNPHLKYDIELIERVQRTFTRKVCSLCNLPALSYADRLKLFKLDRLELRRLQFDLTELFKIVKNFSSCNLSISLRFSNSNLFSFSHLTRGHRYKLIHNSILKIYLNLILSIAYSVSGTHCLMYVFNTNILASFKKNCYVLTLINI
jgi:hypothetical protein